MNLNLMNKIRSAKNAPAVEAAVEYVGHRWVISIRNPGQRHWVAHRSTSHRIQVYNHLNEVVKTVPAVQAFSSKGEAIAFLDQNMPGYTLVSRSAREIEEFLNAVRSSVQ